ncbi:MAG: histidine--tRNA ligase [Chloroflexi bacterium]|nr:histidine--tRNA ligase [Chloroflexota bacterium]
MYRAPRGTTDILPQDQRYWRYVERRAVAVCQRFGYQRIDTPLFEAAGLFVRSVGEDTDIVEKETYTFQDRGGDELTLRPEGTAPVCRAYLEQGMHNLPQPVRLYYFCPIFRYERPQAGRYRQHHQFGIEAIGDGDPLIDVEVIQIGWTLLQELELQSMSLVVNSIGDPECRPGYHQRLREYYRGHLDHLCDDCRRRFDRNPLRLLDCKKESCQPYIAEAPRSADHLCAPCREHWDAVTGQLDNLEIPYRVDHRLVRGLDYYSRTVFEIQPPEEGSQSTILGGGRYDGLIQELGGRPTPGVGFGSGMERIIVNLKKQQVKVPPEMPRPVVVVALGDAARIFGVKLAASLRSGGLSILVAPGNRSLKSQLRYASSMDARYALIVGDEELQRGVVGVRDMDRGEQRQLAEADLPTVLQDS